MLLNRSVIEEVLEEKVEKETLRKKRVSKHLAETYVYIVERVVKNALNQKKKNFKLKLNIDFSTYSNYKEYSEELKQYFNKNNPLGLIMKTKYRQSEYCSMKVIIDFL